MFSALSSIPSPWNIILIVLGVAGAIVFMLIRKGASGSPSTSSWKNYIGGQGMLLFGFLLIGGVLAWLCSYVGPSQGKITRGTLIEYRDVNPSQQVLVEEQDVQNYKHVAVFAQTAEPKDASATIIIYGNVPTGEKHEIARIEAGAGSWSRWEQPNSSQHLTITISTGTSAHPATKVNVLVFLSSE